MAFHQPHSKSRQNRLYTSEVRKELRSVRYLRTYENTPMLSDQMILGFLGVEDLPHEREHNQGVAQPHQHVLQLRHNEAEYCQSHRPLKDQALFLAEDS